MGHRANLCMNAFFRSLPLALASLILCQCASHPSPASLAKASLPRLMVERLAWMDEVAEAKQARSLPVNDPKREGELLAAMEKLGREHGLAAAQTRAFFQGQMQAAKVRQEEWLKAHPASGRPKGKPVPDLAKTIRPALDAIGKSMIARLAELRSSGHRQETITEAETGLKKAGYSSAVIRPAMDGLQRSLK